MAGSRAAPVTASAARAGEGRPPATAAYALPSGPGSSTRATSLQPSTSSRNRVADSNTSSSGGTTSSKRRLSRRTNLLRAGHGHVEAAGVEQERCLGQGGLGVGDTVTSQDGV